MPDLTFTVEDAMPVRHAAEPTVMFRLYIENGVPGEAIQSIGLRCQIQIEPTQRNYSDEEKERLYELFGESGRWGQTLKPLLWATPFITIPPFTGDIEIDLPLACSYDFNIAATKYFAGLNSGEVPLLFLFSGTVFYDRGAGLRVAYIPWEKEAKFRFPVNVWEEMMELYYPNSVWLRISRDVFDKLYRFRMQNGQHTWDGTLEELVKRAERRR